MKGFVRSFFIRWFPHVKRFNAAVVYSMLWLLAYIESLLYEKQFKYSTVSSNY